ncbi:LAFA_0C04874g1_1 [Lachancea sp. 'fantastica']|nr:LAFA_0C04874g1_1 [Lachancea sp. 'fantastica']
MVHVGSAIEDDIIVDESALICCLSNDDNNNDLFILKEDGVYLYNVIQRTIKVHKTLNLKGAIAVAQCIQGDSDLKYLAVLKKDCEILMLRALTFEISQRKRLELDNCTDIRRADIFFDNIYRNFHLCIDGHSVFCIETSKLFGADSLVFGQQIYRSSAEIVEAICVSVQQRNFLVFKKNAINGTLDPELITPFAMEPQPPHIERRHTSSVARMVKLLAQGSGAEKILGFCPVKSRQLIAVVVTSRRVFFVGNDLKVFESNGIKVRSIFRNIYALHVGASLILSLQEDSGRVYHAEIDARVSASSVHWSLLRIYYPQELRGLDFWSRPLSSTQFAFISKHGIWVYDTKSSKLSFRISCEQQTYVDAVVTERKFDGLPLQVVACGGDSPYCGFVESFRKTLPVDTLTILKIDASFEGVGLRDFWMTDRGIVASTFQRNREEELCYISKRGVKLRKIDICCATEVGSNTSDLLYLNVAGQLFLESEGTRTEVCSIAQPLSKGTWSIFASKEADRDWTSLDIILSKGSTIQVFRNGLMQASFETECFNIKDLCVKRLPENTLVIVVTCDTGLLLIISYRLQEKSFKVKKSIQLEKGVPLRLCDIKSDGGETPFLFLYNRHKVWILNLASEAFDECDLGYGIKSMRFVGGKEYIVLTDNDKFISLRLNSIMHPVWTRRRLVGIKGIATHIIELGNPRFMVLASQDHKNACKISILDTATLQILNEYSLPESGTVRSLLMLQKPYDHKILVSLMGKTSCHDSLLVFSIEKDKIVCLAYKMVEGISNALTQRGELLIQAGRDICILRLRKKGDRWSFRTVQKSIQGSGPLSLICKINDQDQLTVVDSTRGVRVYDLNSAVCSASSAASFFNDRHEFATLFETNSNHNMRDIKVILRPIIQAEKLLYMVKLEGTNLTLYSIAHDDAGKTHFHKLFSRHLPFSKPVTRFKQVGLKDCMVCAKGGLYIVKVK